MQHWHVYRKWNERLFMELYQAYRQGRAEKSPEEFWAKGEIGFFDFYSKYYATIFVCWILLAITLLCYRYRFHS